MEIKTKGEKMKIDIDLLHKERKQWRENSLLQTKSILRLSQELDNLRKQKEILQEKLLKSATQDQMNCWHCNTELIWGGDHDTEDNEEYDIVSNLSCPKCHSAVDVWHPSEKLIEEYKKYENK